MRRNKTTVPNVCISPEYVTPAHTGGSASETWRVKSRNRSNKYINIHTRTYAMGVHNITQFGMQ
jgi:hypothetical protein